MPARVICVMTCTTGGDGLNTALAALEAEVGALIGPIEHGGRYSIEKIVAREKPRIRPLDEVVTGISSALRRRKESELFEDWLAELRSIYRDEVRFFAENIEALGSEL